MAALTSAAVAAAAARLEQRPAEEVLAWALEEFGDRFAIVTSFQVEGMVALDLARRLDPGVRVLTLDTGRLPEATYEVIEAVRARLGVRVEMVAPDPVHGGIVKLNPLADWTHEQVWAGSDKECGLHHASPSARFDQALARLRADVASDGHPRPASVRG